MAKNNSANKGGSNAKATKAIAPRKGATGGIVGRPTIGGKQVPARGSMDIHL